MKKFLEKKGIMEILSNTQNYFLFLEVDKMIKEKSRRSSKTIHREIEELREVLNRQQDFSDPETLAISTKLDRLIVEAMRVNYPLLKAEKKRCL